MRAIIVDDSSTIRMIIRRFLVTQGFGPILDGKDGRDALEKIAAGPPLDLAVVDWNMPIMNGLEFVTAVRELPALNGMRIVVVTTESGAVADVAKEAGADGFVTKPFTAQKLQEQLVRLGLVAAASSSGSA